MAQSWQYDVVDVTGRGRGSTGAPTSLVQDRAQQGWVLMTVVTDPHTYGGRTWAYFKRQVPELAAA